MQRPSADARAIAWLTLGWLLAILLIDPRGEFPTTDDWAYAWSVRMLVEQGVLRWHDWAAANLLSHFLWGALFGKLFGVSYFVLRCSTLVAAWLGALAFYRLARLIPVDPATALIATILALFNPLAMSMSFGFMSDVGFASTVYGALLLLAEGARRGRLLPKVAGWGLGIAALLSRQTGLAVPIGWAAGRLVGDRRWTWIKLALLIVPTLLFVLVQAAFQHWLVGTGRAPTLYGRQMDGIVSGLLHHPGDTLLLMLALVPRCFVFFGGLGLPFVLAVAGGWLAAMERRPRGRLLLVLLGLAIILAIVTLGAGAALPAWTLARLGLGQGLRATLALLAGVLAGSFFAVVLVAAMIRGARERATDGFDVPAAALLTGLALLGATMLVALRFDRYLIPIFGCALLVLAALARGRPLPWPAATVGFVGSVSLALVATIVMHDQMAEKRIQSAAYDALASQVGAWNVNGYWVLNGLTWSHCYLRAPANAPDGWLHSRYLVMPFNGAAFRYEILRTISVPRWTPGQSGRNPIQVQIDRKQPLIEPPGQSCPGLDR